MPSISPLSFRAQLEGSDHFNRKNSQSCHGWPQYKSKRINGDFYSVGGSFRSKQNCVAYLRFYLWDCFIKNFDQFYFSTNSVFPPKYKPNQDTVLKIVSYNVSSSKK